MMQLFCNIIFVENYDKLNEVLNIIDPLPGKHIK